MMPLTLSAKSLNPPVIGTFHDRQHTVFTTVDHSLGGNFRTLLASIILVVLDYKLITTLALAILSHSVQFLARRLIPAEVV